MGAARQPTSSSRPATSPTTPASAAATGSSGRPRCSPARSAPATSATWTGSSTPTPSWCPSSSTSSATVHPKDPGDSDFVYRQAVRAKAFDALRGILPAASLSNLGIYGTGQAYEALLLRMRAHPLPEARSYAGLMLTELRKVIPSFLKRVDLDDRGVAWSTYLAVDPHGDGGRRRAGSSPTPTTIEDGARGPAARVGPRRRGPHGRGDALPVPPPARGADRAPGHGRCRAEERLQVVAAYVGDRTNRRHKPGRALERVRYRFDVLADYGAFRDLQRHRLLTIEWQPLSPRHGFTRPEAVDLAGVDRAVRRGHGPLGGPPRPRWPTGSRSRPAYAVCLAYKVRFVLDLNARSAMHLIELRSSPAGPPRLPDRRPGDAPAHRRAGRPPRRGRDDALRRPLARARPRAPRRRAPRRSSAASPADPRHRGRLRRRRPAQSPRVVWVRMFPWRMWLMWRMLRLRFAGGTGEVPCAPTTEPPASPRRSTVAALVLAPHGGRRRRTSTRSGRGRRCPSIAARNHTTVRALAEANGLGDANRIIVGQVLVIPGRRRRGGGPATVVHVVAPGETLGRIGRRYGTTARAIADANGIRNINLVVHRQPADDPARCRRRGGGASGGADGDPHRRPQRDPRRHRPPLRRHRRRHRRRQRPGQRQPASSSATSAHDPGADGGGRRRADDQRLRRDRQRRAHRASPAPTSSQPGETLRGIARALRRRARGPRRRQRRPPALRRCTPTPASSSRRRTGCRTTSPTCPVPGATFVNDWGFPRSGGRAHEGTDLFAPRGTPDPSPRSPASSPTPPAPSAATSSASGATTAPPTSAATWTPSAPAGGSTPATSSATSATPATPAAAVPTSTSRSTPTTGRR